MKINGTTFDVEAQEIIETLRRQLAELGLNRFEKIVDGDTDIMVCCPYHKNGQERRPSAGIRKSDGLFHCLACGETHSLPEVVSDCFGYNNAIKGYKWLESNFGISEVNNRERVVFNISRGVRNSDMSNSSLAKVSEEELDKYRYTHSYLYERGLTDDIIEQFDLGYDKTTDSITFPVRDANGNCLFVARRSVKTKFFNYPQGVVKPLYGLYELTHTRGFGTKYLMKLYVCEGLFDCLRLWCNGRVAVAGLGCLFNAYQIKQLQDLPIRTIVLALDSDDAGEKATKRLGACLTNKIVKTVILPDGRKDIGECTNEEIQNLKEDFL